MQPQTKILFQPLLDESPTDTSTMLTAMADAEKIAREAGQQYTVFTADQQLYAIVLDIMWPDPQRWVFFVPRLGGMHWLTSFIGARGTLMKGSGLSQWLSCAFAGVEKMLIGKKFPMNMRALRFAVIELLRGHVNSLDRYDDRDSLLGDLADRSVLAEHWINNLIKPVLLMMLYLRAEREGDFSLHLYTCKQMIACYFAAKHVNYARYGICYIDSMEKLDSSVLESVLKGEHAVRHRRGIWNAIWSDMMIESSYMKEGKGPMGVIGVTTKPATMKVWAKSLHDHTEYISQLKTCGEEVKVDQVSHEQENQDGVG